MNNAIAIRRPFPLSKLPACPIDGIDDDELDVRLWANILSGQRGSPVYLGKDDNVLKARTESAAVVGPPHQLP